MPTNTISWNLERTSFSDCVCVTDHVADTRVSKSVWLCYVCIHAACVLERGSVLIRGVVETPLWNDFLQVGMCGLIIWHVSFRNTWWRLEVSDPGVSCQAHCRQLKRNSLSLKHNHHRFTKSAKMGCAPKCLKLQHYIEIWKKNWKL